jgi:hypothetical protein
MLAVLAVPVVLVVGLSSVAVARSNSLCAKRRLASPDRALAQNLGAAPPVAVPHNTKRQCHHI